MVNVSPSSLKTSGASAGSIPRSRQWRQCQHRTRPALSVWTPWGTACHTAPWCALPANTPGFTGLASRDRPCAQGFFASSAPSAETETGLLRTCSLWGSESHSEMQRGRTTVPMHPWESGTGAVMPATAFTHTAGSRQRKRGELSLRGITASPQPGGAQTEHQSCEGALRSSGHFVLMVTTRCFPQALAAAPLQLLCCTRHSLALFQLESKHNQLGVQHLCWRGHRLQHQLRSSWLQYHQPAGTGAIPRL
ncbi:uncharacterized protein LOC116240926 isoform X1 [Phasianus colchicus]|uniref:uncharacterized protein LOC116240926 isoform X1 n=1 Tax=Phasianus colchicus TaxID=9054 RepID=UPI00129E5637|nr:uncharacterized protein LOC116240926 isoform X1 [Phasianus colchicus]